MIARAFAAGVAAAGVTVILSGCGGSDETTTKAPATPFKCTKSDTVAKAWDNHFGAFGEFHLDKIMCDYDETSVIAVFNDKCPGGAPGKDRMGYSEHKGTAAIRAFFDDLFTQLGRDGSKLDRLGPKTEKDGGPAAVLEGDAPEGNVFLTWRAKNLTGKDVIDYATDSFSFRTVNGQSLIWKQNIVTTEPNKNCTSGGNATDPDGPNPSNPTGIYKAWKNHFTMFGKGANGDPEADWEGIMDEYNDDSVVQVFDTTKPEASAHATYDTPAKIKGMFKELFEKIDSAKGDDGPGIKVPIQEVEEDFQGVFLVWSANSHPKATDTFVFDKDGKYIIRQNIVVQSKGSNEVTFQF